MSGETKLQLPDMSFKSTVIEDLVLSLQRNFRVTVSRDLRKALYLAVCLLSISRFQEARQLLLSFLGEIVDHPNSYVWGDREEGYALVAYIAEQTSSKSDWKEAFTKATDRNFDGDNLTWVVEQALEDLEWKTEDEPRQMKQVASELKVSEVREGLVSSIIQCSRHLLLLSGFFPDSQAKACDAFRVIIQKETRELRDLL